MTSRVVTSWIAEFGTSVFARAAEMALDIATKDSVDSFPPITESGESRSSQRYAHSPFRIAALPDLMASEAIFAMTSGRASKMIRRTPIGQDTRSKSRPSSSLVRKVTLPTVPLWNQ